MSKTEPETECNRLNECSKSNELWDLADETYNNIIKNEGIRLYFSNVIEHLKNINRIINPMRGGNYKLNNLYMYKLFYKIAKKTYLLEKCNTIMNKYFIREK